MELRQPRNPAGLFGRAVVLALLLQLLIVPHPAAAAPSPRNMASPQTPGSPTNVIIESFGARSLSESDWSVPLLFGAGVLSLVAAAIWGTRRARARQP